MAQQCPRGLKRFRDWIQWCGRGCKSNEEPVYLQGFVRRPTTNDPSPSIPMSQDNVHNVQVVSIVCTEMGEICMGLGYIAELLRYPPANRRTSWTLSYAVWMNDNPQSRLLWRKFFANVAAFFYIIDATNRKLINVAKKEIVDFTTMHRTVELPQFLILIFLNNSDQPGAMNAAEVEEILGIEHPKCLGYLIQPMRERKSQGFRSALDWLNDHLVKNAQETTGIYPDQIARQRSLSARVPLEAFPTFDLKHVKATDEKVKKRSKDTDEKVKKSSKDTDEKIKKSSKEEGKLGPESTQSPLPTAISDDGSAEESDIVLDGRPYITFKSKPEH